MDYDITLRNPKSTPATISSGTGIKRSTGGLYFTHRYENSCETVRLVESLNSGETSHSLFYRSIPVWKTYLFLISYHLVTPSHRVQILGS